MRVVVIGNGMVGSRLVEDLLRHDPDGSRFAVTVLGAEPYQPYNRVLLTEVVAGRADVASIGLPAQQEQEGRLAVLTGVGALRLDRDAKQLLDSDGHVHDYDVVVFATGAAASRPSLSGLQDCSSGVHVLRDLDDTRGLLAAARNAGTAVVLGSGVLGVEVACGLAGRGLGVTLLGRGRVMDRQFGDAASQALSTGLATAGVATVHGRTVEVAAGHDGRFAGVTVDGQPVWADLLVLSCGTAPRVGLAVAAGLPTRRGIVTDAGFASPDDPSVFAIGDCAEPPEGASGLIAQGWDQARLLARRLTEVADTGWPGRSRSALSERSNPSQVDAGPAAASTVVKVKSDRVAAVAMGEAGPARRSGDRRLVLADPEAGRHVEVVVRGDTLVGAICIGDAALAADLTATFGRRTPIPVDPALSLVRQVPGLATAQPSTTSLTRLPGRATICRCNGVSKGDIVACWREGARTVEEVAGRTRATTGCGTCTRTVGDVLDWVAAAEGVPDDERPQRAGHHCPSGSQSPGPAERVS